MALQNGSLLSSDRKCVRSPRMKNHKLIVSQSLIRSYRASIQDELQKHAYNFVLCDPGLPDHPIVYASDGFLEMTGYSRDEVLGRNCRFLQGRDTDKRAIVEIREAIREERDCQIKILNYTKAGKPFWNLFHLAPVFSQQDGRVVHFVGVQLPISSKVAARKDGHLTGLELSFDELEFEEHFDNPSCKNYHLSEEDKQRAFAAVKAVLQELANSSCKGVSSMRNPHLPDMPIVHASLEFLELTGYTREEVIGRNCRFLQGPDTDLAPIEELRSSISEGQTCTIRILNYRKNKEPFWNSLHISPVRNSSGKVAYYAGIQVAVSHSSEEDEGRARMQQLGTLGAIKVAVRSIQTGPVLRKSKTIS
ncbi:protein TWIN LOV 1 isoform X2 [Selaginella moellendorffii]|uniref:protein TWIN LOV 1 isoform X2 n=1 Tax=Selaginella moellendorffii TaxID=88036 RepID=UPI000D1C46C6|nr:protein TWIN LOV 1 isoform X2 [Selaginella moellendorffii]|eukprot:XP_024537743.1 protein TWIN LOV 1 isoform X2 [Selaginella moellendorffii]